MESKNFSKDQIMKDLYWTNIKQITVMYSVNNQGRMDDLPLVEAFLLRNPVGCFRKLYLNYDGVVA